MMKMNLMNDQWELVVWNVDMIIMDLNNQINECEKKHEYDIFKLFTKEKQMYLC
jgi:hypothetical protein